MQHSELLGDGLAEKLRHFLQLLILLLLLHLVYHTNGSRQSVQHLRSLLTHILFFTYKLFPYSHVVMNIKRQMREEVRLMR